jgi:hypothetical protein
VCISCLRFARQHHADTHVHLYALAGSEICSLLELQPTYKPHQTAFEPGVIIRRPANHCDTYEHAHSSKSLLRLKVCVRKCTKMAMLEKEQEQGQRCAGVGAHEAVCRSRAACSPPYSVLH